MPALRGPAAPDRDAARSGGDPEDPRAPGPSPIGAAPPGLHRPRPDPVIERRGRGHPAGAASALRIRPVPVLPMSVDGEGAPKSRSASAARPAHAEAGHGAPRAEVGLTARGGAYAVGESAG